MTDRKALKAAAREAMRASKPHPFWVTLGAAAILAVLMWLSMRISGAFDTYRAVLRELTTGEAAAGIAETTGGFGSFLLAALEVMTAVISVGYVLYCLRVSRREEASFTSIFDAFGIFLRALFIRILRGIALLMWEFVFVLALSVIVSVVLVIAVPEASMETLYSLAASPWLYAAYAVLYIPLFIVSYFYRLADYFMLDHPEMNCIQCLAMSRMAMRGRKRELFMLDLSFLGWYILSVVPLVAVWVQPYMRITEAGFYNAIAPDFLRGMEERAEKLMQEARNPRRPSHGYTIPGRRPDEDEDDPE